MVNIYLSFYPITSQREFPYRKTQLCQGRTQWCQKITVKEHICGEFTLVHLTFGSCTSPTDNYPFTYHHFNGPGMCSIDNFQCLIFGNSQSPNKFRGNPKIFSIMKASQESLKHKSIFMFTFTLCNIYEVNGTSQYLKMCWPATDNNANLAALLQHEEDNFSKLMVQNKLRIGRNKLFLNKWSIRRQIGYPQRCSSRLGAAAT